MCPCRHSLAPHLLQTGKFATAGGISCSRWYRQGNNVCGWAHFPLRAMKHLKTAHQHLLALLGGAWEAGLAASSSSSISLLSLVPKIPVSGLQAISVRGRSSGKVWYHLGKGEWHILSSVNMRGCYLQRRAGSGWKQGVGLGLSRGDQLRVDQPCWQRSRKGHGAAGAEMLS